MGSSVPANRERLVELTRIPLSREAGTHPDDFLDMVRAHRDSTACRSALIAPQLGTDLESTIHLPTRLIYAIFSDRISENMILRDKREIANDESENDRGESVFERNIRCEHKNWFLCLSTDKSIRLRLST